MRVRVYYNLNKSCWSVQHYLPGKGWRVRQHLQALELRDVTFKVSEAGRQRVIRQKRKNVHAYVIGELVGTQFSVDISNVTRVRYNPYSGPRFVTTQADAQTIIYADMAYLTDQRQMYVSA